MKKINKVLVLSAILAGIFGASIQKNKTVVKTEAAAITVGTKLYLEPTAQWTKDGARFAAYFFNGDGDKWIDMTQVPTNPLFYEVTVSLGDAGTDFDGVIFLRMNPAIPENGWDNDSKWNKTNDLVYDGTNDLFTIVNPWNESNTGTWSIYVPEELPELPEFTQTIPGIKSDKVRIWLDRSDHYEIDGYEYTMKIDDTYYKPTGYAGATYVAPETPESPEPPGRWFAYFDMPLSVLSTSSEIELVIFLIGVKQEIVVPAGIYSVGDNNKVWKVNYNDVSDVWSLSKGAITERIKNSFLAKVLEGYLTCSPSAENGYNAYPAIDENFIPKVDGEWNVQGNLDMNIVDYAGEGTASYGSDRGAGVPVNAYSKYLALQTMYTNNLPEGSGSETNISSPINSTAIAFIVITIAVSLFAGLFFFYKKKFVVR